MVGASLPWEGGRGTRWRWPWSCSHLAQVSSAALKFGEVRLQLLASRLPEKIRISLSREEISTIGACKEVKLCFSNLNFFKHQVTSVLSLLETWEMFLSTIY